jgi:endonuclease/exonuclease/phosphatase family metal-dependent hydrolase
MSVPIRTVALGAAIALTVPLLGITAADAHAAHATGHHATPLVARSALGDDPKNANGRGPLKVKLTNTANGRIKVHWKGKGPKKNFKPWKIVTSTSRDMTTDRKVYHAKGKKRSIVVKPAPGVTPTSGNYTFVKVYAKRKHGLKGGNSPTHWIQPTPPAPTGTGAVTIGTFNVRDADIKGDAGTAQSWNNRKANVIATIRSSGAGIVNIQEASGMGNDGTGAYLSQASDIMVGTGMQMVSGTHDFFAGTGSQGTRILYDPTQYSYANEWHEQIVGNRFIEWAEFTQLSTGKKFWDVSMHLQTGDAKGDESLRVTQAKQIIAKVRELAHADGSREVFLAGDSNSTFYSKPKPLVHRTFTDAGFYDAFASASISGQAYPTTNDFKFPVKPGPTRRDVILSYNGPQGSYWYHNLYYTGANNLASDHFMQVAQLPLA